eukprot:s1591_g9.t1
MGQSVSASWLSAPLAKELLEELRQFSLQAPGSFWAPGPVSARFRWAVNINDWKPSGGSDGEEFRLLLSLLKPEEQESIMSYRALPDRKRTLLGRLLGLRACAQALGQSDFAGIQIGRTKGKKPFLLSPLPTTLPNFNFNVSHDGNWVVLASDPIFLVGADVSAPQQERGEREDETWYQDLQAVLTDTERECIKSSSSAVRYATFQRIWSAKEAVSKAVGLGLAFGLERMEVQLPGAHQENLGNLVLTALGITRSETTEPAAKKGRIKFSSLLDSLQNGKSGSGRPPAPGGTPAPATREEKAEAVPTPMQRVEIHIDGWPRADWTVYQEELRGSWISMAMGPVDEAVDANGTFRATFRLPGLGGPSDLEALQGKLDNVQPTSASGGSWIPHDKGFQTLPVEALLPQEAKEQLAILRGRDVALAAGV